MYNLIFHQNDSEWEAELEGELNEYEMVGEDEEGADNPEWENQIQELLEAESKKWMTKKQFCIFGVGSLYPRCQILSPIFTSVFLTSFLHMH